MGFWQNFESVCVHTVDKFCQKDVKKAILANEWGFERSLMKHLDQLDRGVYK